MLFDFLGYDNSKIYFRVSDGSRSVFTSNNNLSLRKQSFNSVDKIYCEKLFGGEDMYICLKSLKLKKKYMVDPEIIVKHLPRRSFSSLLRQFYNYGCFGGQALKSLEQNHLEIFFDTNIIGLFDNYKLLLKFKTIISAVVYLNSFNLFIMGLIFLPFITTWGVFFYLILLLLYLKSDFLLLKRYTLIQSLGISAVRFFVNLSFLLGGLISVFKKGVIFIPPAISLHSNSPLTTKIFFNKSNYEDEHKKIISQILLSKFSNKSPDNILTVIFENQTIFFKYHKFFIYWFYIIKIRHH